MKRNWTVVVHDTGTGDSDPTVYGPWTQRRAEEIRDAFNRTHDARGWYAVAGPLECPTIPELRARYEDNTITETRGDSDDDF